MKNYNKDKNPIIIFQLKNIFFLPISHLNRFLMIVMESFIWIIKFFLTDITTEDFYFSKTKVIPKKSKSTEKIIEEEFHLVLINWIYEEKNIMLKIYWMKTIMQIKYSLIIFKVFGLLLILAILLLISKSK